MKKISITVVSIFAVLLSLNSVHASGEWYEGGTLQKASLSQWNKSTLKNKIATSADWAITREKILNVVQKTGTMETLKIFAVDVALCVDEVAAPGDIKGSAPDIAGGCMMLMGW